MVSIYDKATGGTLVDPHGKRHLLDMPTTGAALTRVGRVNSDHCPASLFRFAEQQVKELRPRSISDAFRQLRVFEQVAHHQGLHRDQAMCVDDLAGFPMGEVLPAIFRSLMNVCDPLVPFLAFRRLQRSFVSFALDLYQLLLFRTEEAGILNRGPIGEIGEGLEPHIYAYLFV